MANGEEEASFCSDNDEGPSECAKPRDKTKQMESAPENPRNLTQEIPRNQLKENEAKTPIGETHITSANSSEHTQPKKPGIAVENIEGDLNINNSVTNGITASAFSWLCIVVAIAFIGIYICLQNSHSSKVDYLLHSLDSLQLDMRDLQDANTKIREYNHVLSSQVHDQERLNYQLRNDLVAVKRKVEELEMAQRKLQKLQEVLSTHQSGSLDSAPDDTEEKNSIWNYFSSSSSGGDFGSSANGDMFDRFLYSTKQLRKTEFRSQTDDTWTQLEASTMKTMSEIEPSRPSAVLILSPPSLDPTFGPCFAKKIALAVNDAFQMGSLNPKVLDSQYLRDIGSVSNIHDDLNAYLKSKGKAVVVSNLAEIQEDPVLMVLHAFCENSNTLAPDSRANFFSTVTVPPSVYNMWRDKWSDYWQGKHIATDTLDLVWQTALTGDKRAALISRVASAVVLLQEGDTCV